MPTAIGRSIPRIAPLLLTLALSLLPAHPRAAEPWAAFYGNAGVDWVYGVAETPDGGYAAAGATVRPGSTEPDFWVFRVDADGVRLWEKILGGPGKDKAYGVAVTPEGLTYAAGYTESFGAGTWDVWVIKLDAAGEILWQRTYGGPDLDYAYALTLTEDGGCLVAGSTYSSGSGQKDILLLRIRPDGSLAWQKAYGGPNSEEANGVCRSGEGFCVAGWTQSYGSGNLDAWLVKVNFSGMVEWQKTFGGSREDYFYDVAQTEDGGFLAVGATQSAGAGNYDVFVVRTDAAGSDTWEKVVGGTYYDSGGSVAVAPDGSFAVSGHTQSFGTGGGDINAWVFRGGSDGALLDQRVLFGNKEDRGYRIIPAASGGYLMAGGTKSYGPTEMNAWLVRLDDAVDPGFTCVTDAPTAARLATAVFHARSSTAATSAATLTAATTAAQPWAGGTSAEECCVVRCVASASAELGDAPLTVAFSAEASAAHCPGETSYTWNFGDQAQASGPEATHVYSTPGTYAWTLTATNGTVSCLSAGTVEVAVPCTLACDARANPSSGNPPLGVDFSVSLYPSNCQGEASVLWDFGDGSTSTEMTPSHTYATPGSYNWTFRVTQDGATCADQGQVVVFQPCSLSCTVVAVPSAGEIPFSVAFDSRVSAFQCTEPPVYTWDFGDGGTSGVADPTHVYLQEGTYAWSFTVESGGVSCAANGTVTALPPCDLTCEASLSPAAGTAPLVVSYQATASAPQCANPPTFLWNFGDGQTSASPSGLHTYASAGTFPWRVDVVTGNEMCTRSGSVEVAVRMPGDCDGDGQVSIGEVQKAINMFLGVFTPTCGADCNGDGTVSIGEVQKVINCFLGLATSC